VEGLVDDIPGTILGNVRVEIGASLQCPCAELEDIAMELAAAAAKGLTISQWSNCWD